MDVRRIELVTRRYRDLQGLRVCAFGIYQIGVSWIATLVPLDRFLWFAAPMLLMLPWAFATHRWCNQYYSRRFGRVRPVDSGGSTRKAVITGTVAAIAMQIDSRVGADVGLPGMLFLMLAGWRAWHCLRDWPHRPYLVIDVCGALVASIVFVGARPLHLAPDLTPIAYYPGFFWIGLSAIVTGALDHLQLARTLPEAGSTQEDLEHANTV
jgi:hypothetical protein